MASGRRSSGPALPEASTAQQLLNRAKWNTRRMLAQPSFFTCGYAGRDIVQFVDLLTTAGVRTLVDIRANPVSLYKPEFSRDKLAQRLAASGVVYVHRGDLGVPTAVRNDAAAAGSRAPIWRWYDTTVVPTLGGDFLLELEQENLKSIVFMCVEVDPTACHRHRLALALEKHGTWGYDL